MEHITSCIDGRVLAITIDRPEKKNALTLAMYSRLAELLNEAQLNNDIHVVTICGSNGCFSAGNDLHDFLSAGKLDENHPVVNFLLVISSFKKPIIAGVSGYAVGIGTTMLMHCDLVYAAPDAQFQLPFVHLGLCPEAASSLILPNLMGYHKAAELLMFGDMFGADKAHQCGMINDVVRDNPINDYVAKRAAHLAKLPFESVLETKRLLKANGNQVLDTMKKEINVFDRLLHGPDCQRIIKKMVG